MRSPLLIASALLLTAAGGLVWSRQSESRQWARARPALPATVGDSAPGLDARLAACAARFASWPADRVALAEFAQLCQANGRLAEAMQAYEALLLVDPDEARWPHLLASLLTGYGRHADALPLLERAATLAPNQPIVWLRLGEVRLKSNRPDEAVAAFTTVLKLKPGDPHALFGLARCDLQSGRLTAARSRLQEAVAADPALPGAQSLLATVWERLGNPAAAEAARRRVSGDGRYTEAPDPWAVDLAAHGHDPYALLVAASALSSDGQPRSALPLLARALTLAPQDARLHRQLGNTHVRLGDLSFARAPLERALTLAPGDEKIRTDLLNLLRELKDSPAAEQVVLDGLTACPDSNAFRFEAGLIAARAGRNEEAIARFTEVWTRESGLTAAPCELAATYFAAGREAEGAAVLEKLAAQHPDDAGVLTLLVRRGISTRDPRTGDWLRRAQTASRPPPLLAELRQAYFARFGVMP
ncbi:tetratricopeptide repeat protein [Oleiharenicola lentus]|uniref:tetratricopeptide repeat protein n=1 Tax=Oleiharenicola lentus TaxID=2508720 RepID=UPI0013E932AC|nr:tetratricopeptide repeat protein [Oleiharenicola lentus]